MRKKKEESIENFLNKLIRAKGCFDVAEMESYIKRTTSYDRDLLDRQIERVEKLLDTRYGHYGKITEENEVEAWRQGFYVLEKLGVTLDDIRRMIGKFNIEEDSPMGIRIRQDWNYLGHLLNDYLYLENANLITYLKLLKDSQKRIGNQKMYSAYSDMQLDAVYDYLCKEEWIDPSKNEKLNFRKVFRACGLDVTQKIKFNTRKRGAKACLRVVVEVLTGGFSAVLVNQYFSDNEGKELNLASHNRVPSYDDCKNELKLLLAQTA